MPFLSSSLRICGSGCLRYHGFPWSSACHLEKGAPATLIIRAVGNRTAPTICPARTAAEQPCQPGLEPSEGL